jgi:TRAP-type C4-dicarboxylate transport system substrate-binding protein
MRTARDECVGLPRRAAWIAAAAAVLGGVGSLGTVQLQAASPVILKFATLVPEGTTWVKAIQRADRELQDATSGAVRFKLYPGGVAGDEKDVLRKMRLGQFHVVGISGASAAGLVPELHVLHAPFLFETGGEVDYVLEQVLLDFRRRFEARGFRLLGFTETGFSYLFSKLTLASPEDLRRSGVLAWVWADDPFSRAVHEAYGTGMAPLAPSDVLVGLQTGAVNTVYAPPAVAVAMQWHTQVGFRTFQPVGWSAGVTLMSEQAWQQLSPAHQQILLEITGRLSRNLIGLMRQDNAKALAAMEARGLRVSRRATDAEMAEFQRISFELRRAQVGKLYPQELLDRVESLIQEYRARSAASAAGPSR